MWANNNQMSALCVHSSRMQLTLLDYLHDVPCPIKYAHKTYTVLLEKLIIVAFAKKSFFY